MPGKYVAFRAASVENVILEDRHPSAEVGREVIAHSLEADRFWKTGRCSRVCRRSAADVNSFWVPRASVTFIIFLFAPVFAPHSGFGA